jgi:hypothetical protein
MKSRERFSESYDAHALHPMQQKAPDLVASHDARVLIPLAISRGKIKEGGTLASVRPLFNPTV